MMSQHAHDHVYEYWILYLLQMDGAAETELEKKTLCAGLDEQTTICLCEVLSHVEASFGLTVQEAVVLGVRPGSCGQNLHCDSGDGFSLTMNLTDGELTSSKPYAPTAQTRVSKFGDAVVFNVQHFHRGGGTGEHWHYKLSLVFGSSPDKNVQGEPNFLPDV